MKRRGKIMKKGICICADRSDGSGITGVIIDQETGP